MREQIQKIIGDVVESLFHTSSDVELTRPDPQHGDYATNVALKLAGQLNLNPEEVADQISKRLLKDLKDIVKEVTTKNGFINIRLKNTAILEASKKAAHYKPTTYKNKAVVVEYSDPNPFKVLHAGHLYTSVVGDSIANLLERAGATVHRVNFGGDVGLHVAKTLWAIIVSGEDASSVDKALETIKTLETKSLLDRASWLAEQYVQGTRDYDDGDDTTKKSIQEINKQVYKFHAENDHDSVLAQIYWTCRQWSYDYFEDFYQEIGVHPFEKYYPESQTVTIGLKTVREQLQKGVYKESDGAVVFDGEKYGLHTRVFINSVGLPTYETKDVGLIMLKWQDYHFDRSIVITGNDQSEYMKVVLKSIEQFDPKLANSTTHLTHGIVKLKGGEKMSSRKGNILQAAEVINATSKANEKLMGKNDKLTTLGAVKYSLLKQRLGADIIYDPEDSVSLAGNSGPYLQYAYARAHSILEKAGQQNNASESDLEPSERPLAIKVGEYPEVLDKAVSEYMPHFICSFLYELAQIFNSFYETNRVIDDPRQGIRLQLIESYAATLKSGLELLNIPAPDHL